jgi:hypothetical protein
VRVLGRIRDPELHSNQRVPVVCRAVQNMLGFVGRMETWMCRPRVC